MRSFLLALALLTSGTVLASEAEGLAQIEDDAKFAYENGAVLLAFGTSKDVRTAMIFYRRVLELDPYGKTTWHAKAVADLERAGILLREMAEPMRTRARRALAAGDFFEAERALHEAMMIDPGDAETSRTLAEVRVALRLQAVELQRQTYPWLRPTLEGTRLGVPPAAERITNVPRFSIIPSTKDRG